MGDVFVIVWGVVFIIVWGFVFVIVWELCLLLCGGCVCYCVGFIFVTL